MSTDNDVTWEDQIERMEAELTGAELTKLGGTIATRQEAKGGILLPVSQSMIDDAWKYCQNLKIAGTTDLAGYKAVKDAKWRFVRLRTAVEKWKKEINEEARKQIKANDEQAKKLFNAIEPKESELQARLTAIDVEIARAKQEAEDELYAMRQKKLVIAADGYHQFRTLSETAIRMMTETEFDSELVLVGAKAADQKRRDDEEANERFEREQEQARIAAENRKQAEKLAAERAEMDRQKAEMAAAQAKIDAETRRLMAERKAKEDAELLEKTRAEAAEKARIETEQRIASEAEAASLKAEQEAAAKLRAEVLRPDREKIEEFAEQVSKMPIPPLRVETLSSEAIGHKAHQDIRAALIHAGLVIKSIAASVQ